VGDEGKRGLGYALVILGMAELHKGNLSGTYEEESIAVFSDIQDKWGLALALNDSANVLKGGELYHEAQKLYEESLRHWEGMEDSWGLPLTLSNLGFVSNRLGLSASQQGNSEQAHTHFTEGRSYFGRAMKVQEQGKDRWGLAQSLKVSPSCCSLRKHTKNP
jgi:hypothetical protein